MPTPLELAIMAQGAYKIQKDEKFQPPKEWYIVGKFSHSKSSWDVGVVIYERIMNIDDEKEDFKPIETSPEKSGIATFIKRVMSPKEKENCKTIETSPGDSGKIVTVIRVERVFAFRGTEPSSVWNWGSNLGLFFGQVPPQTFISTDYISHNPAAKKLFQDLEEESTNVVKWPLHAEEISKRDMPQQLKEKLMSLLVQGRSLRPKIMQTTYTGHSLGASMAIVRSAHDAFLFGTDQLIRATVFDSPGSFPLLTTKGRVWAHSLNVNDEQNVVSYLSAPNIVNTLHPHIGQVIRLYVPHIQGKYLRLSNALISICEDIIRYLVAPLLAIKFTVNENAEFNVLNSIQISMGFILWSYLLAIPLKVSTALVFNAPWLLNQHSIENMISCFDPTTRELKIIPHKPNGHVVTQWPGFYEHNFGRRLVRFLSFPLPNFIILNRGFLDAIFPNRAENTLENLNISRQAEKREHPLSTNPHASFNSGTRQQSSKKEKSDSICSRCKIL